MFCKLCQCDKEASAFYASNQSRCKSCVKASASSYRQQNLEKVRAYDRMRASQPHRDCGAILHGNSPLSDQITFAEDELATFAARLRATAMAEPGWQMVPIEPTDEMEAAAENDYEERGETFPDWKSKYRAMLAAAPTPHPCNPEDAQTEALLMQDENSGRDGRRYNEWHASRPDARLNAREAAAALPPAVGAEASDMRDRLQRQCSAWGAYWRASDAHGVEITKPQAVELLQDALGVEVEIKDAALRNSEAPAAAQGSSQPVDDNSAPTKDEAPKGDSVADTALIADFVHDFEVEGDGMCSYRPDDGERGLIQKAITAFVEHLRWLNTKECALCREGGGVYNRDCRGCAARAPAYIQGFSMIAPLAAQHASAPPAAPAGVDAKAVLAELIEACDAQDDWRMAHPALRQHLSLEEAQRIGERVDKAWQSARALATPQAGQAGGKSS